MSTGSALDDLIKKARDKRKAEEEKQKSSALRGDRDDKTRTTSAPVHQQDNNHGIGYGSQPSHPTAAPTQHADWYKPIFKDKPPSNNQSDPGPQIPKWKSDGFKPTDTRERDRGPSSPLSQDNNRGIGYGSQRPMGPQPGPSVGPQIPTWRSDTNPAAVQSNNHGIGYGSTSSPTLSKPVGPQPGQPGGPMIPAWKAPSPAPSFGDRETMDSDTPSFASQVGLSVPRVNTGPTAIGSMSSQPTPTTASTPSIQPWRPDWNLSAQADRQAGAFGGQRDVTQPTTTQPGLSSLYQAPTANIDANTNASVWRKAADVVAQGVPMGAQIAGDWLKDGFGTPSGAARMGYPVALPGRTDAPITNAFVDSAAYERMQESFKENADYADKNSYGNLVTDWQKNMEDPSRSLTGEIGKWWSGEQGAWDTVKKMNEIATGNAAPTALTGTALTKYGNDALAAVQASQDWMNLQDTSKITGYENSTVGSTLASGVYGGAEGLGKQIYNTFTGGETKDDPFGLASIVGGYNQSMQAYTNATQSPDRTKDDNAYGLPTTLTPEQIKKNRERAMLNWADPTSVEKTFNQLNDKDVFAQQGYAVAQQLTAQAQQETDPQKRAKLMADAADAGAAAYHAANDSPMAIVNANTNFWKQLPLEILEPDITSVLGQIFEVAHLTPKERRLASTAKSVMVDEAAARKAIEAIPVVQPTEKIASVVKPSGYNPLTNLGTTGQARAAIDAAEIHKVVATLLADADTTADARLLLTQLARDPKQLIDGMDANLFQSEGLLARADADGKVRFGSMGMNTDSVQRALNSYRSIADEFLANADSLNKDGMVNKIDLMSDVSEATTQGGYRYYNVANEAGKAAYGDTQRVRVKTLSGGEAYIEYVGKDGKVIKTGDKTTLLDANRQATALNQTLKKGGKLTDDSLIKKIGDAQRRIVSPFYITTSPGTWMTNISNAVSDMFSDKTWTGATQAEIEAHTSKLYGGVKPTRRSMEGVETAGGFAGNAGLLGPLKKGYSKIEEFFAEKTAYSSTVHALQTYGPQVLEDAFTPVLQANGITDPATIKKINNKLFEVGYMGGDMQAELANLITGNSKAFSVSDVNRHYLESIPASGLEEFYGILKSSPDPAVVGAELDKFFDRMRNPWEEAVQGSPPVPQRHSWMKTEIQQDMADFSQVGNTVVKNGGMTAEEAKAATQAQLAAQKAIDEKMSALTDMVKDATDPSKRYVLYDTWGQIRDKTNEVRALQAEAVEKAYSVGTPEAWKEYHATMDAAWKGRNEFAEGVLNNAATALHSTAEVAPNLSFWDRLERTAKVSEESLYQTLRLEPQSGRWDSRLGQVIEAGRNLVDKKVSEVFAAARRFGGASVMDEIVSAEKSAEIAGAQANYAVRQAAEKAAKTGKWEDFYSIRNEVYRQMRHYEATVWDIAKRNIIEEGLAMESKGGKTFEYMGEQVELVRPAENKVPKTSRTGAVKTVTEETANYWIVKRPDGTLDKIADSQIPAELKADYKGLKPADIDAELQMEMDNIASAQPLAKDAQSMIDGKTAKQVREDLNLGSQATIGEKWDETARETSRNTTAAGATRPPEVALAANHALEQLEAWRRYMKENLADILAPSGKMGDAQAFNVMNEFKKTVMPAWDNVKFTAAEFADRMRSFTHIDFRNQTRLDEFMGLGTPYSFYYTRAAKNALERMIFEPQVWSRVSKIEKGIKSIREQNGDPTRFDGAIPITIGGHTRYIRIAPSKYWPLFQNFFSNNYADPENANSNFSYAVESAQAMGFGVYPWLDAAAKYAEGRPQDISIPSYAPQGKIIAWGALKGTGYNNQIPHALLPQNYEYNVGRELTNMVAEGKITQEQALYARDWLEQQKNGGQPLPGQTLTPELKKILDEANNRAANVQLEQGVTSYVTGASSTPYNTVERDTLEAKKQYKERKYDPVTNPYGSGEGAGWTFQQHKQLGNAFAQSNLFYPDSVRSGAVAENTAKRREADKLYADMNQAVEAYLQSHPEASSSEVQKLKAPYYDQIDALDKKYPNAAAPGGSDDPTKGMNPAERAQYELDGILKRTAENKPEYPGKDATPQQLQEYYAKLNEFTPAQRASVEQALNGLLAMDETEYPGISQWKSELRKLVGNKYASEIIRYNGVKRASLTEQDWDERMAVVQELTDIQREKAKGRIVKELGQTAYDTMQAYYALPKGSDARKQYEQDHPEVKRSILMAYNPKQYDQAKTLFGQDVWDVFFDKNYPQYPGDNASEADMKAYHDQLDAYNKANPRSEEIRMWVKGRKRPDNMENGGTAGGTFSLSGIDSHQQIATQQSFYDFGTDWAEAKRIFGPDIFKTIRRFPQTDDKKVIGKYLGAHPELTGYWQWKKDLLEHPERAPQRGVTWDVPSQTLRDAVAGQPRPLGSNAQPIGSASAPFTPTDLNANNHGIGYGAQTPPSTGSGAAVPAELPSTQATAVGEPVEPTAMDALDYARQDPKFVKREAINAQIAAQNAAVTKQFGQDTFNLYQQYTDLPKDSDARKQFMKDHPELRGVMAWLYGRSADRDKDSKAPPAYDGGKDYEEAKKRFGDGIWDLYGQYNKDWSKAQKKAFFSQHPEYGSFMDWWYGPDGKGEYTPHKQHVYSGRSGEKHGGHKGPRKRRGGYWIGNWWIDENGVPHMGGPNGPVGAGPGPGDSQGPPQPGDDDWTGPVTPDMIGKGYVDSGGVFRPGDSGVGRGRVDANGVFQGAGGPEDNGFGPGGDFYGSDGSTMSPSDGGYTSLIGKDTRSPRPNMPPVRRDTTTRPGGLQGDESLDAVIVAYREAAQEDPQNDWLTHMPPEIAAEELQKALTAKKLQRKPGGGNQPQTLAELIALYREAAKEDPQNDWLTHLPPEVAQQELAIALGSGGQRYSKGKGWYSGSGYNNSANAYVPTRYLDRELQVDGGAPRPWRPEWISRGWMNAGQDLKPGELRPWRAPK